jgi:3'-phosphoadenosine 5'-phosphosulfate sulfotransferase (PAPS reductase)/FAD synthetase
MASIEQTISADELDALVKKTVRDIKKQIKGKNAAFAWSGGKDSLVLEQLCYMADIGEGVLVISELEYRAFLAWVTDNMPPLLEVISTGQDLEWLSKHPAMLFPQDSATAAKWFHIVQHRGQAQYAKRRGIDLLLLGRRKADGNYVGRNSNIYTDNTGTTRYSPLSDWRHEDILAFIHYHDVPLPPFYGWVNGYYCGTHPWAARQWTQSVENGWREVYAIDPSIVVEAANYIDSAKRYLESEVA